MKRLEPYVFADPLLALLETALTTEDPEYDPYTKMPESAEGDGSKRMREVTARAITQCYADIIAVQDPPTAAKLHGADIAWLRWLSRIGAER